MNKIPLRVGETSDWGDRTFSGVDLLAVVGPGFAICGFMWDRFGADCASVL